MVMSYYKIVYYKEDGSEDIKSKEFPVKASKSKGGLNVDRDSEKDIIKFIKSDGIQYLMSAYHDEEWMYVRKKN